MRVKVDAPNGDAFAIAGLKVGDRFQCSGRGAEPPFDQFWYVITSIKDGRANLKIVTPPA